MSDLPFRHVYNLARLGNAGDVVRIEADAAQRAAIATWSGVLSVEAFTANVDIRKVGPAYFRLDCSLAADVTQACVVTLEKVPERLARKFTRELHFTGPQRPRSTESEVVIDADEDDVPEEIDSLHYDLAGPLLEEYSLALEPYPRAPGVEFAPPEDPQSRPESPFAVLKRLK